MLGATSQAMGRLAAVPDQLFEQHLADCNAELDRAWTQLSPVAHKLDLTHSPAERALKACGEGHRNNWKACWNRLRSSSYAEARKPGHDDSPSHCSVEKELQCRGSEIRSILGASPTSEFLNHKRH
jgi:hypothetical protein